MRQYTTPTLSIKVKGVDLTAADSVWVTLANTARTNVITKDEPTLAVSGSDTNISVTLTQEETRRFSPRAKVDIQVNWMTGDVRCATDIASVTAFENLLKEIIEPEGET